MNVKLKELVSTFHVRFKQTSSEQLASASPAKISDEHYNLHGTVLAGTLQSRIPHTCLGSDTLVVVLLLKMIINIDFLVSTQAELSMRDLASVFKAFKGYQEFHNTWKLQDHCRSCQGMGFRSAAAPAEHEDL